MADRPELRAGDHDRDRIAERLRDAAGDGRIDLDELTDRLDRVYAARTLGELDTVVADLVVPAARMPVRPLELHTRGGRLRQVGQWAVPTRISARAGRWGTVVIDFTQADCPHSEVRIDLEVASWFGDIVIVVPRDWWVRDDGVRRRLLGAVFNRPPSPPSQAPVLVRLTGTVRTGDVWVKYR
jgi:hypothetical protein